MKNMPLRLTIFEFLATPAYLWIWCCARMCGGKFECGIVYGSEEEKEYFRDEEYYRQTKKYFLKAQEYQRRASALSEENKTIESIEYYRRSKKYYRLAIDLERK